MVKAIDTSMREMVREEISNLQAIGQLPTPEVIESDQPETHPSSETKKMLSDIITSEGCYAKIYKINSSTGKKEPKGYDIEFPIQGSLEAELNQVVKEKGWGSGDYVAMGFEHGKRGILFNKRISTPEPTPEEKAQETIRQPAIPKNPMIEGLDFVDKGLSIVERLKPIPVDIAGIMKETREAMKEGREISGGNGADNQLINLIEKLSPLIVPFLTKPQLDENSIIEKIVARLQPNLQPKEDKLTELIKLKDGLGLKFTHESKEPKESSLDSVRKVTEIVSALRPLTGTVSGEPQSTLSLVLEHLPKLVEPLLTTLKEFAEAKKMEMQLRMEQHYGGERPTQIEGGQKSLSVPRVHPFTARIIEVVNKNDESYFDMMRQQISRLYGQHVIDGLIDGNLTSDLVIETLHTEIGLPLNLPNLKPYLNNFIKHLQEESEIKGGVLAECKLCKAQYDFPDMKAWEIGNKKCEDCQGDLELIKREGEA